MTTSLASTEFGVRITGVPTVLIRTPYSAFPQSHPIPPR
jgi:hypothetical protein